MPDDGDVVVFKDVTKRYRDVVAVDRASFTMRAGDVFGFIGPNGAGKTTTIRIMVGLIQDHEGQVSVGGHPMPAAMAEAHRDLGYMPQQVNFQDWRTVDQALSTFARLSGVPRDEVPWRIKEVLELVDILEYRGKRVTELSGGTLQKVGMAQALIHRPKLLVLDEPMSGLDPASRWQFKQIIKNLGRAGTSIFFSSHILSDVQDVANRIGILSRGRLMWTGTFEDLAAHFKVTNDYDIVLSLDNGRWKELASLAGLTAVVEVAPGRLLARIGAGADVDATVHAILAGLLERGCRVRSLGPITPNLEQLYMRYVQGGGGA
jgi:ABC-2 type transport system ATP-binding protein